MADSWGCGYLVPGMSNNRWKNVERDGRNNDSRTLESVFLNESPVNVTVAGHSFVRHLNTYACENHGFYHNLKLEQYVANVNFVGISGLTVSRLINDHLHAVVENQPSIVYLELGTNDLSDPRLTAKEVGNRILELCRMLLNLGVRRVIIGEITFRVGRGIPQKCPDFNYKVLDLNQFLQVHIDGDELPGVVFWRHKYLWQSAINLYRDGLHYNRDGNKRLFRSVRGAVIKALWAIADKK